MKIDILTIFPDFFRGPLDYGIIRRAREAGLVAIEVHDLRAFAHDRHRTVDDRPFGGGEGMVLKPEPIFECIEGLKIQPRTERIAGDAKPGSAKQSVVLLSAQGARFDQGVAERTGRAGTDCPDLRPLRRRGRARRTAPRRSRAVDRRLRAERRRIGRGGHCGHGHAADSGRGRQRGFDPAGVVHASPRNRELATVPTPPAHRADCSTIRITRGRRIFVAGKFRRCWCRAITKRYAAGAGAPRWKKRCATGPICWIAPR